MYTSEIQMAVDELCSAMIAKGKIKPEVAFEVKSNRTEFSICFGWTRNEVTHMNDYHWEHGATPAEVIGKATAWVVKQPSAKEIRDREFIRALADAVELGKKTDFDTDALMAAITQASSGLITFDPSTNPHLEIPF